MTKRVIYFSAMMACLCALLTISAPAQSNSGRGRKFKDPPPTARIEITVLRATNGKPIENASVVFHEIDSHEKGNMQLKTNEDGKTVIDVLAIGATVRFQVIAQGYQTYGQDFKVDKANLNLEVRLSRPVDQYTIYKDHSKDAPQPAPAVVAPDAQNPQPATTTPPATQAPTTQPK